MNSGDNTKKRRPIHKENPFEILKDAGRSSIGVVNEELVKPTTDEFIRQILGRPRKSYSGEIGRGESVEMKEVFTGGQEGQENLKKQLLIERRLIEEERVYVEKRTNELRLQIQAIHEEIVKLAQSTPKLAREVEIAAIQVPSSASSYELSFLKHIFKLIEDFRVNIEKASTWLAAINTRAQKKNVWGARYKKHGAKYLLSGEHYLTRSAS
jgi:hypothetical protein